jgi:glyoxylase-like metal-dependent hydrolase (beta-lactamase superfamily II)
MMGFMVARFKIGQADIGILGIAGVRRDLEQLVDIFPSVKVDDLKYAIQSLQPDEDVGYLDWYFNAVLIQVPEQTILVDTGFGFSSGGTGLGTVQLLGECDVQPQDVDTIVISHGHGDHIGGLTEAGSPAMPDARVVISRQELEFWMNGEAERCFGVEESAVQRKTFSICRDQIECIDMDSFVFESTETTIRALPSPGHTPGHIGIEIQSLDQSLWLLVDTIHALFQMQHPDWSPRFDIDPDLARTTRKELLGQAARLKLPVHLYHFPFPAIGTVAEADRAFMFEPITKES